VRIGVGRTLLSVGSADGDRAQFTAMFDELSPRVFAYVRRQCDAPTAQDVVADTFLIAWTKWARVPATTAA
jgi:DNA-directed RNA polymerase specialized sigma24 family protein